MSLYIYVVSLITFTKVNNITIWILHIAYILNSFTVIENIISDFLTPQTGETALNTMRYFTGEKVQTSGDFQTRQCKGA